jgi:hypothetical protein
VTPDELAGKRTGERIQIMRERKGLTRPVRAGLVGMLPSADQRRKCYEPGEYCRGSDHGASGVAGDGKAISCEDNDGWRWEPS